MAEIQAPAWLQGGSHTAQGDRLVIGGMYGVDTPGGVIEGFDLSPGTPGVAVEVGPGIAVVNNPAPWGGPYHVGSDSTVTVALAASDPANPRLDLLVAQVYDSAYFGAEDKWALEVVEGTAGPNPVTPAVPDRALVLAEINIFAGAASLSAGDIADRRTSPGSGTGGGGFLKLSGGTMSGPIAMGNNRITGLGDPTAVGDAVTKAYADGALRLVDSVATSADGELYVTAGQGKIPANTQSLFVQLRGELDGAQGVIRMTFNGGISAGDYRSWRTAWRNIGIDDDPLTQNRDDSLEVIDAVRIGIQATAWITKQGDILGQAHGHESGFTNMTAGIWGGTYRNGGLADITSLRFRAPGSGSNWRAGARVELYAVVAPPGVARTI